jgi:diadenosine tetraphosphate (Ap4A) HIT family hydrolase
MIYQSPDNPNSHLTVKERQWPSYPTKQLLNNKLLEGKVLDFGCGTGIDVAFLKGEKFDITGYDPYYVSDYPTGKFDTIICNYVLNVLLPEEQAHVLMAVSELLKSSGRAYFTVRRDITQSGFRTHSKNGNKVYQCNVLLPYKSILTSEHCEIYEYRHFNQQSHDQDSNCPFCRPTSDIELITESATAYALLNRNPTLEDHALIIPKRHITNYFELPNRVKTACWLMVDRVKMLLDKRFQPGSFNISIDVGPAAGQTIPHAHICLIPRK